MIGKRNVLGVLLLVSLAGFPRADAGLNDGLVAYYPLDGNADDASGNNHHGIAVGVEYVGGVFGQAGSFGVNRYIELPITTPLGTDDFAVSLWIKSPCLVADEWCSPSYNLSLTKSLSGDWNYFAVYGRGVGLAQHSGNYISLGATGGENDRWYHYVVTRDDNTLAFYIDGVLVSSETKTVNVTNWHSWRISGQHNARDEHYFNGLIDEVRLYDRALSEREIQVLYRGGDVCSPLDVMLQELVATVVSLNLQQGISNSLDAKLEAAIAALDDTNDHNDVAAMNALDAFIYAVKAQRGDKISDEGADALIGLAMNVLACAERE